MLVSLKQMLVNLWQALRTAQETSLRLVLDNCKTLLQTICSDIACKNALAKRTRSVSETGHLALRSTAYFVHCFGNAELLSRENQGLLRQLFVTLSLLNAGFSLTRSSKRTHNPRQARRHDSKSADSPGSQTSTADASVRYLEQPTS